MLALVSLALGSEPAHYHPDRVAQSSARFARFAEALGPAYEEAQRSLTEASLAVEALERSTLLSGDRADEELRAWTERQRRLLAQQYLRTQAHVSLLEEDSAAIFGQALEEALAAYGEREVEECAGPSSVIALVGPGGRSASASCEGESLNAALAARIDEDAALAAAVDEILAIPWPEVGLEVEELDAVGAGEGYLQLAALTDALFDDELDGMAASLEDKLAPYEERIAAGDEQALAEADAIRARYELAMAEAGERILEAAAKALKKGPEVGLCANPEALGGCAGEDRTAEVLPLLTASRKLQRALE